MAFRRRGRMRRSFSRKGRRGRASRTRRTRPMRIGYRF